MVGRTKTSFENNFREYLLNNDDYSQQDFIQRPGSSIVHPIDYEGKNIREVESPKVIQQ